MTRDKGLEHTFLDVLASATEMDLSINEVARRSTINLFILTDVTLM